MKIGGWHGGWHGWIRFHPFTLEFKSLPAISRRAKIPAVAPGWVWTSDAGKAGGGKRSG